ncbi:hypothetical protein [Pseudodesulfovibrio sp.]|uniref:hypothetical protein n=1 Tax=unclassified Pseudodesulfovibrio TaxID=2661612 RepID=UPI003AFF8A3B
MNVSLQQFSLLSVMRGKIFTADARLTPRSAKSGSAQQALFSMRNFPLKDKDKLPAPSLQNSNEETEVKV